MMKMKTIGHSLEALEKYFSGRVQETKPSNYISKLQEAIRPKEKIVKIGTRTYKVRRSQHYER